MTVQYTENFKKLSVEAQNSIKSYTEKSVMDETWYKLQTEQNRSLIFCSDKHNLVLKVMIGKGKSDKDIESLTALSESDYFPNLYAFEEREFLIMDKALGKDLSDIKWVISEDELEKVKLNLYNALSDMLDVNRYDWDFKEEHIFWDIENSKLTWIDLGICDPAVISTKADKERKIQSFYRSKPTLKPISNSI
ncbi:MAG: hypothetical protein ABS942_15645 [Solibacillus sp.]